MQKMFGCFAISALVGLNYFSLALGDNGPGLEELRTIKVCVLIDARYPVKTRVVCDAYAQATQELSLEVETRTKKRIVFQLAHAPKYVFSSKNRDLLDMDELGQDVNGEDIRVVFSNRGQIENGQNLAGECNWKKGLIALYNAESNTRMHGPAHMQLCSATLIHEIEHLFGVDHTEEVLPFWQIMNGSSKDSWMCNRIDLCRGGMLGNEAKLIGDNFWKYFGLKPKGVLCDNWWIADTGPQNVKTFWGFYFLASEFC